MYILRCWNHLTFSECSIKMVLESRAVTGNLTLLCGTLETLVSDSQFLNNPGFIIFRMIAQAWTIRLDYRTRKRLDLLYDKEKASLLSFEKKTLGRYKFVHKIRCLYRDLVVPNRILSSKVYCFRQKLGPKQRVRECQLGWDISLPKLTRRKGS